MGMSGIREFEPSERPAATRPMPDGAFSFEVDNDLDNPLYATTYGSTNSSGVFVHDQRVLVFDVRNAESMLIEIYNTGNGTSLEYEVRGRLTADGDFTSTNFDADDWFPLDDLAGSIPEDGLPDSIFIRGSWRYIMLRTKGLNGEEYRYSVNVRKVGRS